MAATEPVEVPLIRGFDKLYHQNKLPQTTRRLRATKNLAGFLVFESQNPPLRRVFGLYTSLADFQSSRYILYNL